MAALPNSRVSHTDVIISAVRASRCAAAMLEHALDPDVRESLITLRSVLESSPIFGRLLGPTPTSAEFWTKLEQSQHLLTDISALIESYTYDYAERSRLERTLNHDNRLIELSRKVTENYGQLELWFPTT